MTSVPASASLQVPEASSPTSTSASIVHTPPSEASGSRSPNPPVPSPPRRPSPLNLVLTGARRQAYRKDGGGGSSARIEEASFSDSDNDLGEGEDDMMERPPMHRPSDGRSQLPLLYKDEGVPPYHSSLESPRPLLSARRSTFRSITPADQDNAMSQTRRKYTYAGFFLLLSLVSFVIQTETAIHIQHDLGWKKAYSMLYFTHGSWSLLWPATLLIIRIQKRKMPWKTFWRRHVQILRTTAQMVESQDVHLKSRESHRSPVPYILKKTAIVTTALTIAGGSWYVAVDLTSASDLTAIYNCSAFFAYAFSIPLLGDKLRFDKMFSVAVAIAGVLIVAYGDAAPTKHGGKSGGSVGGGEPDGGQARNRTLGNIIIGIGSVLYGLYEVLYKKLACPPEGTSPGRGMIFAMFMGSLIGSFTLTVLWIPIPILHFTGLERFELPTGTAAWMLLISVLANAVFSGSFLVLISLTSPVLSSVAALLTIFLVAIVDWALPGGQALSAAAIAGGMLIIVAFLLLSWSTYREMNEERIKRLENEGASSDSEDD